MRLARKRALYCFLLLFLIFSAAMSQDGMGFANSSGAASLQVSFIIILESGVNMVHFNKLNDTDFPQINNINVFKYENNFDYKRWAQTNSIITLTNVRWGGEHKPYFRDKNAIIEYFEKKSGVVSVQNSSIFNIQSLQKIRVDVPFEVVSTYNYLWIKFAKKTPNENILNENGNKILERFYFIKNAQQLSPSTTEIFLEEDIWLTYYENITYKKCMLERGHYPVVNSADPDTFLADPINNSDFLLDSDYISGLATTNRHVDFREINGNDKPAIVLIVNRRPDLIFSGAAIDAGQNTAPAYNADNTLNYSGSFSWIGQNGENYPGIYPSTGAAQPNTLAGNFAFFIEPDSASTFFNNLTEKYPYIYEYILGVYVMPRNMILKGSSASFNGIVYTNISQYNGSNVISDKIILNKNMWDINTSFTKMYTAPYSQIKITMPTGNAFVINPQDISKDFSIKKTLSTIFPWVNITSRICGINGNYTANYTWHRLNGETPTKKTYEGNWLQYVDTYQIPAYVLWQSSRSKNVFQNAENSVVSRRNSIQNYNAQVRQANLAYNTVLNNNALNTSNTNVQNSMISTQTANNNTYTKQSTTAHINEINAKEYNNTVINANMQKLTNDAIKAMGNAEYEAAAQSTNLSNQNTAIGAISNVAASIAGGAIGGPVGIASGIMNGVSASVGAVVNASNNNAAFGIAMSKSSAVRSAQTNLNTNSRMQNNDKIEADYEITAEAGQLQIGYTNTRNSANSAAAISANSTTTANSNSTNATNSRNAQNLSISLAKQALLNAQANNSSIIRSYSRQQATSAGYTSYAGDANNLIDETCGYTISIETLQNDDIKRVENFWDRYGYSLNQIVEPGNLADMKLRKNFTYWQAAGDVWVLGECPEKIREMFANMLQTGITIWTNPDDAVSGNF